MIVSALCLARVGIDQLEVGQKLHGTVKRVLDFGAFVDVGRGLTHTYSCFCTGRSVFHGSSGCYTDGLVHISKMAPGRVDNAHDYAEEDQEMDVWVGRSRRRQFHVWY